MSQPPPDPLFIFHEGMESVFCLLFVVNENDELIYAGTGDGKVHIWDLKDNRRLKTNQIGDNACLQLHQTREGLFVTQEKSGPTTLWLEDSSRHWTKTREIPSSYVGFCRSVLVNGKWLVLPCGDHKAGSTLEVLCLEDEEEENKFEVKRFFMEHKNSGFELDFTSFLKKSGDTEQAICCKLEGTKKTQKDTEESPETSGGKLNKTGKSTVCELSGTGKSPANGSQDQITSLSELGDTLDDIISNSDVATIKGKYLCCKKTEKAGEVMALKSFGYKFLLAVYESGLMKLWCLITQECWSTVSLFDNIQDGGSECPMAIDFHENSNFGIVAGSSAELFEFSWEYAADYRKRTWTYSMSNLIKKRTVTMTNPGANCVKIREDGKLFMVGCWDGRIRLFSCKTLSLLVVLDSHRKKTVQDLVISPSEMRSWSGDNIFASCGVDGRLCLWSVY
ncbi:hypothetical protein LSTR_LSTR006515 [Laodelphax striatellus]|uniref:Uncharacterized protein n=1 Tax=Laodelphax striatellus TaxID=195883 RepID=A0A482WXU1_LAOST|nr:hypothetical protein LSTR_LSTR006515 [Laodelphax striatellus]